MTSFSENQGYQGYPYRNPTATEVQSVDPETASKWTNLPRKQIMDGRDKQIRKNSIHGQTRPDRLNIKNDADDDLAMNVYIDLPIINSDDINQRRNETKSVQNNPGYQGYPYRNPIPTDVQESVDPETALKWANLPRKPITDGRENRNTGHGSSRVDQKQKDGEEPPMNIYVDLPIINPGDGTVNSRRDETTSQEGGSGFVEDTIFYDPFEDRRINVSRNDDSPRTDTPGSAAGPSSEARTPIAESSCSSDPIRQATTPSRVPPLMSKETYIYGSRTPDDNFPLSPIPVSEFPEPPPAYTEVDTRRTEIEPPRTVVVVPDRNAAVGIASDNRKLLICPHCGLQVNTLAVRENGAVTHVLAFIFLCIFAPITLLVYCTDFFKYKNHYCPNCNQLIGYEVPILCQDMIYNKP